MSKLALSLISVLGSVALASTVETTQIKTPRGAMVDVAISVPSNLTGQAPAVVLAPGQGYHMALPILQELADTLSSHGVLVYRFNWNYFSKDPVNGMPSENWVDEVEDMQAVVALAKKDARVDLNHLMIAGKSLGSWVSYNVFAQDKSLKALALLTPLCTSNWDDSGKRRPQPIAVGAKNYPGLTLETRPLTLVLGNNDPNCQVPMLDNFLKGTTIPYTVIDGDHSWNVTKGTDPDSQKKNADNVAHGVGVVASWFYRILGN